MSMIIEKVRFGTEMSGFKVARSLKSILIYLKKICKGITGIKTRIVDGPIVQCPSGLEVQVLATIR